MAKPEALRLADWLDELATVADMGRMPHPTDCRRQAAAELRRLHAQRDALLEALKMLTSYTEACEGLLNAAPAGQVLKARAAIAAVEGETK